jgi:hypothetical protein
MENLPVPTTPFEFRLWIITGLVLAALVVWRETHRR